MTLKICVYAICKNEKQFVQRFIEHAIGDADKILIVDTGSTDGTVQELNNRSDGEYITTAQISVKPWRFDVARNAALSLIPDDIDICVSLDLDEVLQPGWREAIEKAWVPGTTRLSYLFDWGWGKAFFYDKIHARHGYRWVNPVHEFPVPYGIEERYAIVDKLLVVHKPDPTKSRGQYLPMLKMSVEEDPHEPRNAFYYARELSFYNQFEESIKECKRYLALPRADVPNERCYAYRTMGRCHVELGQRDEAFKAFLMAATEGPNTREPWCELAKLCYSSKRWTDCFVFAMRCLEITDRDKVYTVDPNVWGSEPHMYACIGAWNMGLKEIALQQAQLAVDLEPENELNQANLKACKDNMPCSDSGASVKTPSASRKKPRQLRLKLGQPPSQLSFLDKLNSA